MTNRSHQFAAASCFCKYNRDPESRNRAVGAVRGGIASVDVVDVILTVGAYAMKSGTRARRRPVALGLASMLYCYPY